MKFNDINQEQWWDLKRYFDTCVIPITGLSGKEEPWQVKLALEKMRDALAFVEIPYHGRMVTYPALHYTLDDSAIHLANHISTQLKSIGFTYVILLTTSDVVAHWSPISADVLLYIDTTDSEITVQERRRQIASQIETVWKKS